jgi:tetratricopeptide (TPR) repeat protein
VSGFIVCPACGARIKAGRQYCLRCFAMLPEVGVVAPLSKFVSIGLSGSAQAGVAVAATAAIVALVAVIVNTRPITQDDAARPASAVASPRPAMASTANPVAAAPANAASFDDGMEFFAPKADDVLSTAKDLDAARTDLERSLAKQPDDPQTLHQLGQVLARMNLPDEAMACLERAIANAPDNPAYRFNWAHVASDRRQWTQAIEGYGAAARLAPTDYAAQFNFALALHRRGDRGDAIREFQKATALAPDDATAHVALATALESASQLGEAAREYQRFLEMEPDSAAADAVRGRLEALSSGRVARNSPEL